MKKFLAVAAVLSSACLAHADVTPITGWIVHNGTSTAGGTSDTPTFTTGGTIIALMAPFSPAMLANDGDFVEVKTTLTMAARTANTGIVGLNTQIRAGLFDDSVNSSLTANDFPNTGFTIEYSNTTPLTREQQSLTQTNPFTSPTNIVGSVATPDAGGAAIQGKNPGPVTFDIKITRDGGNLDMAGSIIGTDSVSSNAFAENFSFSGYSSTNFPADGTFAFNRIGLFLGGNVDSPTVTLSNSSVTTPSVPEPASCALAGVLVGGALTGRRARRKM